MYKPLCVFIGLRYLWNPHLPIFKKIITVFSIIGISISTSSIIIIISIMNGFENHFEKNILSFVPHLIITNKNKYVNKLEFPQSILKLKNIEKISSFIKKEVIIKSHHQISIGEILGVDAANYDNVSNYGIKNILYKLNPGKYNTIIGKKLAEQLNVNIGDTIKLIILSDNKDSFLGKVFNQHIFKITDIFSSENEIDTYQLLINQKDCLKFLHYSKNYITGWRLWLKNPISLKIENIKNLKNHLFVLDWKLQKGELFNAIKIEKYVMLLLFFLILTMASLNIIITFSLYIVDKKNTIAILKTQGLSQWGIILIFFVLGSSTAVIGNLLGTIVGIFLIFQNSILVCFLHAFFSNIKIPIIMIPLQIFYINITSTLLIMLSILYPSWKASKIKPARILTNE